RVLSSSLSVSWRRPPSASKSITRRLRPWRSRASFVAAGFLSAIAVLRALAASWEQRTIAPNDRSEEHTSELQSRFDLVCRLLLFSSSLSCSFFPYTTLFRSQGSFEFVERVLEAAAVGIEVDHAQAAAVEEPGLLRRCGIPVGYRGLAGPRGQLGAEDDRTER